MMNNIILLLNIQILLQFYLLVLHFFQIKKYMIKFPPKQDKHNKVSPNPKHNLYHRLSTERMQELCKKMDPNNCQLAHVLALTFLIIVNFGPSWYTVRKTRTKFWLARVFMIFAFSKTHNTARICIVVNTQLQFSFGRKLTLFLRFPKIELVTFYFQKVWNIFSVYPTFWAIWWVTNCKDFNNVDLQKETCHKKKKKKNNKNLS